MYKGFTLFHKWLNRKGFFLDLWGSGPQLYGGKLNKENSFFSFFFFFPLQASGFYCETMTYLWKHVHNKYVPHQEVRPGNKFHTYQSFQLKRTKKKKKKRLLHKLCCFQGTVDLLRGHQILKTAIISPISGLTQVVFMTLMKSLCSKAGLESRNQDEWRADILFPPSVGNQKP